MSFWSLLGLEPTTDKTAIRHAYAEKTKACHPEEDPEGFDELHKAFDAAMQYARRNAGRAALKEEPAAKPAAESAPLAPAQGGRAEAARKAREAARAAEQEALEEYQQRAKSGRGAELSLGQGEQENGQQFDFSAAAPAPGAEPEPAAAAGNGASPEPEPEPERPLTPEEVAWRNLPPPLGESPEKGAAETPAAKEDQGKKQPAGPAQAKEKKEPAPQPARPRWGYGFCLALSVGVLLFTRSKLGALAVLAAGYLAANWFYKKR